MASNADPIMSEECVHTETPVLVAVVEGTGSAKGIIGMASMDTVSSVIELRQFADTPEYTHLANRLGLFRQLNSTTQLIIPNSMLDQTSQYVIHSKFGTQTNPIDRANFNDVNGLECIQKLAQDPQTILNQVADKTFSLAALSALIAYVENNIHANFSLHALKISYHSHDASMVIDTDTVAALELLASTNGNSKNSLFGFLNQCVTRGGCKQLRSLILEPPTDVEKMRKRQDGIAELKVKTDLFERLKDNLQLIQVDLEKVSSKIIQIPRVIIDTAASLERNIDLMVFLRHVLERAGSLIEVLDCFEGEAFQELSKKLTGSGYADILGMIREVISEDCVMTKGCVNFKSTKAFAVRKELSQYLEIERNTYSELLSTLTDKSEEIKKRHGLDGRGCKMIFTVARGFHLQVPRKLFTSDDGQGLCIASEFVRVEEKGESIFCTTETMILMCARLQFKLKEINRMSHVFVKELLDQVRSNMTSVHIAAEVIAEIDFLISLATVTIEYDLVKPTFDDVESSIEEGKHPILLMMKKIVNGSGDSVIPNNTLLNSVTNFQLITGSNMAGKSVHIRHVALLQILAQIGCHVPAKQAKFRICDKIFARIGSDDDMETNCSTFQHEIKQMKYIIENMTDNSLIIIDELGRGTSDEEGVGICFAFAEHFIRSKAFTLLATHFQDLHELSKLYHNADSHHFAKGRKSGMNPSGTSDSTHKLEVRTEDVELGEYGIDAAEDAELPEPVIKEARSIFVRITKRKPVVFSDGDITKMRLQFRMADHIDRVFSSNHGIPTSDLVGYLETLRTKALQKL